MVDRSGLRSIMRQGGRSPTRGRGRLNRGDPTKIDRDRRQVLADVEAVKNMHPLDQAALYTSFLPIVGDVAGAAADIRRYTNDPSGTNLAFLLSNAIPFLPSGTVSGIIKAIKPRQGGLRELKNIPSQIKRGLQSNLSEAMPQIPNYLRGFYSGNPVKKLYGVGEGAVKGLANIAQARYLPKDRAILKEFGVPVSQTRAAKDAMKEYKKGKELSKTANAESSKNIRDKMSQAMKKVTGQSRQTTLMGEQFGKPPAFNNITRGLDEVEFGDFGTKSYNKIMGGRKTGLTSKDFNSIFEDIAKAWKVNPKKKYKMNVRRTNTQAAGNLENFAFKRPIYGGSTLTDLKKIFDGKKFKSGKEFLSALKSNNVNVKNPKEVLEGRPAIVVGNVASDAVELGGVRYTTAIKRDGNLVSIMSDEHDLFFLKLPSADRMISVSTPINIDILKTKEKSQRLSKPVRESKEALKETRRVKSKIAEEELAKFPGVDTSLPTPSGSTKSQWYATQALAKLTPTHPDYSRLQKEAGFIPARIAKASQAEQENKRGGGSVMERNPYDYEPRGI